MSISVSDVSKLYGPQRALDQVNFTIKTGQIVGFLGPNGAGKSTMMKIITCFIPPTSGKVMVGGYDTASQSLEVRKIVGYLPEHNMLYLDMFVREYLHFVAGMYRMKNIKSRVSEVIEMVGLEPEQGKQIGALSKGYRQRVGLAQALIHDPQVLILDEPTSGLDPNQLAEIRDLIRQIGRKKTVMLSTHIMQEVEAICDRLIIIKQGKIVADNAVTELVDPTKSNTYHVSFQDAVPGSALRNTPGINIVRKVRDNSYLLTCSEGFNPGDAIFKIAAQHQTSVDELRKHKAGLEEFFKEQTKK